MGLSIHFIIYYLKRIRKVKPVALEPCIGGQYGRITEMATSLNDLSLEGEETGHKVCRWLGTAFENQPRVIRQRQVVSFLCLFLALYAAS